MSSPTSPVFTRFEVDAHSRRLERHPDGDWVPHHEVEQVTGDLWTALNNLSFECFGGIGARAPSIDGYNRAFATIERYRGVAQRIKVTRLEVISRDTGRLLVLPSVEKVELSYQDDGRTLKVFLEIE